jgi:hypothetical protein
MYSSAYGYPEKEAPMIIWPNERALTPTARRNLADFRATTAAKDLEDEATEWQVHSYSWLSDAPNRTILLSDDGEQETVTIEEDGMWTLTRWALR